MTPTTFHIGDRVKVVGPTSNGQGGYDGKEFEIMEEDIQAVKIPVYSTHSDPWYPASSLRLVPKFKKGDRVCCECGTDPLFPDEKIKCKTGTVIDPDFVVYGGVKCVHVEWDEYSPRNLVLAEGLRLVEDELKIGDYAEVIRPGISETGKIIKIIRIDETEYPIQAEDRCWYRRSSLRKLTPMEIENHLKPGLKIGDWAEVIGPCCPIFIARSGDQKIFKIEYKLDTGCYGYDCGRPSYPAKSLRKLSPEEIAKHLIKFTSEQRLDSLEEYARENDKRLSAIEQNISDINGRIDAGVGWEIKFNERQSAMQKSIDVLEGIQKGEAPEVIDREYPDIPIGATFSVKMLPNHRVSVEYSDGGLDLAHMVLDSMRKER